MIRQLVECSIVLVNTENLSRCTIHKQEINGDDCGRGRDNVWSCLRDDMLCIDR
jgi:hypothetical protein